MTVSAPTIIPTIAPFKVMRFHSKDKIINGPKAAPKPAHAYATKPKTLLSGLLASAMANTAMANTIKRPTHTNSFCEAVLRKNDLYKSSVKVLEQTKS